MGFMPIGEYPDPIRQGNMLRADQISGGTITAQQLVIAGGTTGLIRSQNFNPTSELGWAIFGDGSASFYGDLIIGANAIITGDLYSSNWDGAIPANLATIDPNAELGYYLDSSVGSGQFAQGLFLGSASFGFYTTLATLAEPTELAFYRGNDKVVRLVAGGDNDTNASSTWVLTNSGPVQSYATLNLQSSAGYKVGLTGVVNIINAGTVSAPSLIFDTDVDTGINWSTGDQLSLVAGGVEMLRLTEATDDQVMIGPAGSTTVPSLTWISDTNTGFTNVTANEIGIITDGTRRAWFKTGPAQLQLYNSTNGSGQQAGIGMETGSGWSVRWVTVQDTYWIALTSADGTVQWGASGTQMLMNAGSSTTPSYSWGSDTNSGMWSGGADIVGLGVNGTTVLAMSNFAGTEWLAKHPATTSGKTTMRGSAALTQVDLLTSALKYKRDITNASFLADIHLEPTRHWRVDDEWYIYGFIADDLYDQDKFLGTTEAGEVEDFNERAVMAVMMAKINRLEKLVLGIEHPDKYPAYEPGQDKFEEDFIREPGMRPKNKLRRARQIGLEHEFAKLEKEIKDHDKELEKRRSRASSLHS